MQMGGTHGQLPANKSPPTPMVQTPIITAANEIPPVFPNSNPQTSPNSPASENEAIIDVKAATTVAATAATVVATTTTLPSENGPANGSAPLDGHNRTVSQSSGASAPELVAINNSAIISDKIENPNININANPIANVSSS